MVFLYQQTSPKGKTNLPKKLLPQQQFAPLFRLKTAADPIVKKFKTAPLLPVNAQLRMLHTFSTPNELDPPKRHSYSLAVQRWTSDLALLVLSAALFTGCSTFNRDWERMAGTPSPENSIEGRWDGIWKSDTSDHSDRLRCIVSRQDETNYLARFFAKYQKVMSFGYSVPLRVQQTDQKYAFDGEANLHWYAGGMYHYKGEATPTNFFSTYRCKSYSGTFEMRRPAAETESRSQ